MRDEDEEERGRKRKREEKEKENRDGEGGREGNEMNGWIRICVWFHYRHIKGIVITPCQVTIFLTRQEISEKGIYKVRNRMFFTYTSFTISIGQGGRLVTLISTVRSTAHWDQRPIHLSATRKMAYYLSTYGHNPCSRSSIPLRVQDHFAHHSAPSIPGNR